MATKAFLNYGFHFANLGVSILYLAELKLCPIIPDSLFLQTLLGK
ncbi:hypothetical protein PFLA_a2285 [Pseudoalteromonas flavipulchra NCIMB 2033 = ATCC BAA-314]|nr:hypothetical protein [Pseudoalteromonas flavipulchra NCIMB 2033 = ATCC BAA-314]